MGQLNGVSRASIKWFVTAGAIGAAVAHMVEPKFIPDAITLSLLGIALLPWIYPLVKTVELAGFGKLELRVDEVRQKQSALQTEVDSLRFLLLGFVTEWEYQHLMNLERPDRFEYGRSLSPDDRFLKEIVRLRDSGMICKTHEFPIRNLPESGNLKDFFSLTERGKAYLSLRRSAET